VNDAAKETVNVCIQNPSPRLRELGLAPSQVKNLAQMDLRQKTTRKKTLKIAFPSYLTMTTKRIWRSALDEL
jgi:hypothetical protein